MKLDIGSKIWPLTIDSVNFNLSRKNLECKVAEDISKNIINIPLNISDHNKHYYDHFLKIINE